MNVLSTTTTPAEEMLGNLISTIPHSVTKILFRSLSMDVRALNTLYRLLQDGTPSLRNVTHLAFDVSRGRNFRRLADKAHRSALISAARNIEALAAAKAINLSPPDLGDSMYRAMQKYEPAEEENLDEPSQSEPSSEEPAASQDEMIAM